MKPNERELIHALALNSIPGVGVRTYVKLVERFGTPEKVFKADRESLKKISRIQASTIDAIISTDPEKAGGDELEKLRERNFRVTRPGSYDYPKLLARIQDPPPVLYYAGELRESDELAVAVVGSRDPTEYGKRTAHRLARELARAGTTVVSGMARGIDSAAHRGALDGGGRTVAVLGSGLDVIYPPENQKLFGRITRNGAVMSPFALGTRPERGNFPARNRVISGMSLGVVVVQATTPDSGSLITARLAHEQGREVFAVPGEAGAKCSRGTNELIKKGHAKLVDDFADILEEILPQFDVGSTKAETKALPEPELKNDEKEIWDNLGTEPVHIDNLARACNLPPHRVASALLNLELEGLVEQRPGKLFAKTHGYQ